jgi:hypothetical protein
MSNKCDEQYSYWCHVKGLPEHGEAAFSRKVGFEAGWDSCVSFFNPPVDFHSIECVISELNDSRTESDRILATILAEAIRQK